MKKWGVILMGLIFALSTTGLAMAQEKAKPAEPAKPAEAVKAPEPAKPAEEAKPAEAAKPAEVKKEAPKPVKYRAGGLVVALDMKARKITLKQDKVKKERKLMLIVSKKAAKNLAGINVGDEVNVWVTGKTVTNLTKVF
jgi:outer membrane biosynthesis protein TonB